MQVFLLPTFLGEHGANVFSSFQLEILDRISVFVVENLRTARRHLRKMGFSRSFDEIQMFEMGKHADKSIFASVLQDARANGADIALISEAGIPAVADPGADFVALAHSLGIKVTPISGPSSLILALSASGLNGQNFAFCGYLPIEKNVRQKEILKLEKESEKESCTKIFIETPFRADALFSDLIGALKKNTRLCVARDILGQNELIQTKSVETWRETPLKIGKIPTVFLFLAQPFKK